MGEKNLFRGAADLIDPKNIMLTSEEMEQCREFSIKSADTQQEIEFEDKTTKPRTKEEIARDNLIGKIAEVAFSKLMKENYGIDLALDFENYPRGRWDSQDAIINGWRIDVKGTRTGGQWLLIEWNKLNFRQKDDKLSHVYIMFTVGWNRFTDTPTGSARFEGFATLARLRDGVPCTEVLKKGTKLPGKEVILQTDNFGIQYHDLYKFPYDLNELLQKYVPDQKLTDDYKNPRTGETTRERLKKH